MDGQNRIAHGDEVILPTIVTMREEMPSGYPQTSDCYIGMQLVEIVMPNENKT